MSWDRPYGKYGQVIDSPLSQGSGEFLLWEFPLAYWMEKEGYDVSYISNVDTHADAAGLLRAKGFLSVGHDEYWSREMYDNMLGAVAKGLNAAFFSGDTCWGLIPFLPSSAGDPHRIITRLGQFGPLEPEAVKKYPELSLFKQSAPTEANLIGARTHSLLRRARLDLHRRKALDLRRHGNETRRFHCQPCRLGMDGQSGRYPRPFRRC